MNNIFASLTRGASFAKSKNRATNMGLFRSSGEKESKNTAVDFQALMKPAKSAGNAKVDSKQRESAKRKRPSAADSEEEEEDEDVNISRSHLSVEGTDDSEGSGDDDDSETGASDDGSDSNSGEEEEGGGESGEDEEDSEGGEVRGKKQIKGFKRQEEVNAFRNAMQIKIRGANGEEKAEVAAPCPTFDTMKIHSGIKDVILENIEKSNWKEPTPIQMQAIPALLSGRDILAAAPTGSGKTAAFVIPVLSIVSAALAEEKLKNKAAAAAASASKDSESSSSGGGVRALLLAPTRELAEQIHREATRLCAGRRLKICLLRRNTNSSSQSKQEKSAYASYDVLVSTPLRLVTLISEGSLNLSHVRVIALDEADKLFELKTHTHGGRRTALGDSDEEDEGGADGRSRSSFLAQVDEILAACPRKGVRRALFSATIGSFVAELASQFLKNPIHISIGTENTGASTIDQRLVFVGREDGKLLAIQQLVQEGLKPPVLLFVQSIERAKELYQELVYDGINVDLIHAEKSQQSREETIRRFRAGDIWVLICTELMARGVDFKGVQMVINYDLPQSSVDYIHRIGRTGRAGNRGVAVTFFTEDDIPRLRSIANVIKLSGCAVPEWMLTIPKLTTKQKRQLRTSVPKRRRIATSIQAHVSKKDSIDAKAAASADGLAEPGVHARKNKKRNNKKGAGAGAGASAGGSAAGKQPPRQVGDTSEAKTKTKTKHA